MVYIGEMIWRKKSIAKEAKIDLAIVMITLKYDVRMELMERLRRAGFEIRLAEESCEHYAVIDNEIVWYGSMNVLIDTNILLDFITKREPFYDDAKKIISYVVAVRM